LLPFLDENWLLLMPPLIGFVAIYLLAPRARRLTPIWGGSLAAVALVLGAFLFIGNETVWQESLLFYAFAGSAIISGGMMITQQNPVHAALSFALVVLSTCGLFLLQSAPFLMAATIIIYAGAIVVTFLFVIMLAQQEGASNADQRSREPFLASLAGCVLMASLLCVLQRTYQPGELDQDIREMHVLSEAKNEADVILILRHPPSAKGEINIGTPPAWVEKLKKHLPENEGGSVDNLRQAWSHMKVEDVKAKAKVILDGLKAARQQRGVLALNHVPGKESNKTPSHFLPGTLPSRNVEALGRTLFTDYLIPVELAATLLLVATIGAIVIAGRRRAEELR
jgi:NADH-quinone oxidoreductase subunit J